MARVGIACEASSIDVANELAEMVRGCSHYVRINSVDRYPVLEAMKQLLLQLNEDFDFVFVLISNSPQATDWVLMELRLRNCYPKCFPVILNGVAVPAACPKNVPLYNIADIDERRIKEAIKRFVNDKSRGQ